MEDDERVEEVQVSKLRAELRSRFEAKKPLIVLKNSSVVGILFCVNSSWYRRGEHPKLQGSRLRAELDAVLKQICGR